MVLNPKGWCVWKLASFDQHNYFLRDSMVRTPLSIWVYYKLISFDLRTGVVREGTSSNQQSTNITFNIVVCSKSKNDPPNKYANSLKEIIAL